VTSAEPSTPFFSVVICTYNRAPLVPRAIRSVLEQTFTDFELVVVDDGSTDATGEVVSAIPDRRLRYVHRDNGGLSAARNTGVANARGRFVIFLDDDDEALPDWLRLLYEALDGDTRAVVTCGDMIVDEDARVLRVRVPTPLGPAFANHRARFVSGTFALPREAYHLAGGFAEDLECSHQTEFALRVLPMYRSRGWPVRSVDDPLIRHVLRSPERRIKTPEKILRGTKYILAHHEDQLSRSPRVLADYLAVAGVAAARTGDYREARRLLRRAAITFRRDRTHRLRLVLAHFPPLANLVWKARRYRRSPAAPA